jgi:signal transduction histidine kinase/HAMP domain-containing protein
VKLFQRMLWSFVCVLSLQALLTGAALSRIFGAMQEEDAAREMAAEAANANEFFNAWKLSFWKQINILAEDPSLAAAVSRAPGSPASDGEVARVLSLRLSFSAAEAVALRDNSTGDSRYLGVEAPGLDPPDPSSFYFKKTHPYVEISSVRGSLWFMGAVRIAAGAPRPLDLFIVKKIDAELIGQLSNDPMVALAVIVPESGPRLAGACLGSKGTIRAGQPARDFVRDSLVSTSAPWGGGTYARYPRMTGPNGLYTAVVQQAGTVATAYGEKPVLLASVLSLAGYSAREAMLQRSVAAVSLVVMAITIVVALALSQSIVSPIRRLSKAMRRIEGGDYRAEARGPASGELGELLEGFNGMASKLAADKLELEAYISEIVGLKERGDGIIESIREGLAVIDAEGRVESANGSFRALFGEAAGSPGAALLGIDKGPFDEAFVAAARDAMRDRESRGGITRRAADGRSFELKLYPLVAATRPELARCIVVVEDVSERLEYEERVIQADKLSSIGMLSAGVAHEINNPLSSILANVGNAISESGDPEIVSSLRVVERETLRIARIVRQLLEFSAPRRAREAAGEDSGGWVAEASPRCDANAVARELTRLVGYPFRGEGRLSFVERLDPACPEAAIPEDELKQVLLNLLKNALHAVGREGTIRIETRASGLGLAISVADDGPGIPEAVLGRIFDPFFTTKAPSGRGGEAGLGLGLSVVYGIVTKRGGSVTAANGEAGGAVFLVCLPAAEGKEGR